MTQTLKTLIPLAIVFSLLVATNFLYAAWNAPTGTPSEINNAPAPINVSADLQDKEGDLTIGGSVGVFGQFLLASNEVRSPQYCDENGLNCVSTASSTFGGGSPAISKFGEGNRCVDDDWVSACGYSPSQQYQWNSCVSRGHSEYYGWTLSWSDAESGYYQLGGANSLNQPTDVICAKGTGTQGNSITQTSLVPNWPDALYCTEANGRGAIATLSESYAPHPNGTYYYQSFGFTLIFNADGSWSSGSPSDCSNLSISELSNLDKAFSYNATVFTP